MQRLTKSIERLESLWISKEIRAVPGQMAKARLILGICVLFTPPIIGVLGVAWFTLPNSRTQTALILFGHLLVNTSAVALRWSKSVAVPGTIFMATGTAQLLVATSLTGAIVSPVVYAFPVLVVFASTLVELRVAFVVAAALLLGAAFIWSPGYPDYSLFTHHAPFHIRTLTLAWCMATAIGVGWLYRTETRRTETDLRAAIEAREGFLAYLSHELRNPLTTIVGAADLLSTDGRDSRETALVGAIQRSARAMTQVLDDVLDVSKADAGMLQLNLTPTRVGPVAKGLLDEFVPLAETRGIELQLDVDGIADQQVLAVGHRLEQVLRNLLSNAVKFTEAGGSVTLLVRSEGHNHIVFEVADTGAGISEEDLRNILQPFRQGEQGAGGGTGLGLPISSRLLDAMRSKLTIQSRPGEGSSFSFSLPIATPASLNGEATRGPGPALSEFRASETTPTPLQVLLVDDNDEARQVISGLLEQLSCEVQTARNGVEALEVVRVRQPEVLLLDIQMPRLGGIETAEELRRCFSVGEFRPFKVIALTGNVDSENGLKRSGLFDLLITKPVSLAQLEASLLEVTSG